MDAPDAADTPRTPCNGHDLSLFFISFIDNLDADDDAVSLCSSSIKNQAFYY